MVRYLERGDFPERFHPHLHILATDGAFCGKGRFRVAARFPMKALERLAALGTHVPAQGRQSVPYSGFLSNASRGKRRKQGHEGAELLPTVLEPGVAAEGLRKNSAWARLIQKVYEVDPWRAPSAAPACV